MRKLVLMSALSNVCGLIGAIFVFTAFFTGAWLRVYIIPETEGDDVQPGEEVEAVSVERIVTDHGLWDHGLRDLNCEVTPFGICMYTRAGIFAGMVLSVPGILFNILSTAVVASGGTIETSGTLARTSGIVMTLADIGVAIAVILFTIQHTGCISSCPPENTFYPVYPDDLSFGWSFMLAWIGLAFFIATTVILYVFAYLVEKRYKVRCSFSPNRMTSLGRQPVTQPDNVAIELVRVNKGAMEKEKSNTAGKEPGRV